MSASIPANAGASRLRADTLVSSVVILLAASVIQRSVGFGRGILFCRWMDPAELGQWEMVYSFLLLAAPLAVLGVPGSFGRYVERYRRSRRLRTFLRRTSVWTAALTLVAVGTLLLAAPQFSAFIFGRPSDHELIVLVSLSLAAVILHHFLEALLTGLRMFRIVSVMHFAQSLGFAAISLSLLQWWRDAAASVIIGYGTACALSAIGAICWLGRALREIPTEDDGPAIPHKTFWPPLLRFAFWIWLTNLLANLFAVADRYMIVHFGGFSTNDALIQVGHYHSSRVVPLLLLSVADLLSSILLPHLTHDWEANRQAAVGQRLNLVLKMTALGMCAAGVGILLFAPVLFDVALAGKYAGGLAVLPLTLTYCALNGIVVVAMTYLWCAERTGLSVLPMGVALAANVGLNLFLLPRYGLGGAVTATAISASLCLSATYWLSHRAGMHVDRGTLLVSGLPWVLVGGVNTAMAMLVCIIIAGLTTPLVFSRSEKEQLVSFARSMSSRLGQLRRARHNTLPTS